VRSACRGERGGRATGQVADRADPLPAGGHRGVPQDRAAPLGDRQGLGAPLADQALHPQHQLGVGGEGLAVADHRSPAEQALHPLGQAESDAQREGLQPDLQALGPG